METELPRVLLAGCLPPPVGGMTVYFQTLLKSSLPQQVNLQFVATSRAGRPLTAAGRATAANGWAALGDVARFVNAVRRFRPQVCHIGSAFGVSFLKHGVCVLLSKRLGCRVVLQPHCSLAALIGRGGRASRAYQGWIFRNCDRVLALSHEWQRLPARFPGVRVQVIPNGIDLREFEMAAHQRCAAEPENPVRFLYLGYLGQAKGTYDLLAAAALLKQTGCGFSLDLVGEELAAGDHVRVQAQIENEGLQGVVRMFSGTFGADKLAFFQQADAFVYPSYHEGLPVAVMEALGSALPVIASRVGGLPDLVEPGVNGLLVLPGDPAGLADAMRQLCENPRKLRAMGEQSSRLAHACYNIDQHVSCLVGVYRNLIREAALS